MFRMDAPNRPTTYLNYLNYPNYLNYLNNRSRTCSISASSTSPQ